MGAQGKLYASWSEYSLSATGSWTSFARRCDPQIKGEDVVVAGEGDGTKMEEDMDDFDDDDEDDDEDMEEVS